MGSRVASKQWAGWMVVSILVGGIGASCVAAETAGPASGVAEPAVKHSAPLTAELTRLVIPPPWLEAVTTRWDTGKPWKEARLEIRRLLGLNQEPARKEALKLMWVYKEKGDMGNGHEYPMYTFMGREFVWSVRAHEHFLSQPQETVPIYAEVSFAKLYMHFGEFENAKAHLDIALANLPGPPWRTMREAELHDTYGDLYAAWGQTPDAVAHYNKAIALYPKAKPPYGRHLLPRRAQQVRSKRELLSFDSLDQQRLKDGIYKEKALGYSGDVLLTVKVERSRVADIKVSHQEKIDQGACVSVPRQIVQKQSLRVDAVSGATVTKNAIVGGTYRALQRAGLK